MKALRRLRRDARAFTLFFGLNDALSACYQRLMRHIRRQFVQFGKPALAALLIGIVLLLDAMAACPPLHEWIHHDANKPDHHCAVTLFAHGKVSIAAWEIIIPSPILMVEAPRRFIISAFSPFIENLPQGRAPPVSSSIS
ncbi:MAG: hypothetical protein ACREFR_14170 [Limisphaerales bacterium]